MVILWDLIRVKFNRREEGSKQFKKDLQKQHTSNPQTCELNSLYMLILKNKPLYLEELVVILEFLIVFNICMILQVSVQFSSVQFSRSVMSDSLRPHKLQHARPPCPSPTPGVHSRLTSIESVMPSSHLILCRPLLLQPPV